jgi:hypothetical protein
MQANKYGYVAIEMAKENFKFQLMLPWGCPWEVCEAALEEFKLEVADMKQLAQAQAAQASKEEIVEPVELVKE